MMTQKEKETLDELVRTTDKYLPLVQERLKRAGLDPNSPFAHSAAKYYPVLEKLAVED